MRGRKPKPLQRQFAEGDTRHIGARKLNERLAALPKAMRGLGDPPPHLSELAKQQWAIWREDLEIMQQDFRADAVILEGACVSYARAIEADEILKDGCEVEEPFVDKVTGAIGHVLKKHPAVAVSNVSWRRAKAFCAELGLSLISRQRLSIESVTHGGSNLMELLLKPRPPK